MNADVALIAEANQTVGTGHLVEILEIARQARAIGREVVVVVTPDAPSGLLARSPVAVKAIANMDPETLAETAEWLMGCGVRVVLTNLRQISNEQVCALAHAGARVVCIDEVGGRHLNCHAVINPTPIPSRHRYPSDRDGCAVYAGPAYLALAADYARWHDTGRVYGRLIQSVVVSMGGVDWTGATRRIVEMLGAWQSQAERHVVVGAACPWEADLTQAISKTPGRWHLHRNLRSLAELLAHADVGISAGGNTLSEMACVGTPALVLYEDTHEAEQATAFEERGFGQCLGAGTAVTGAMLRRALDRLEDPALRQAQGEAGRRLIDGRGVVRICHILAEQLSLDCTVTTRSHAI